MKQTQKTLPIIYAYNALTGVEGIKETANTGLKAICSFAGLSEYKICKFVDERGYVEALGQAADMTDEQYMKWFGQE